VENEGRHRRSVLAVTTLGVFLTFVNGSIVLISLPAIFRGLRLDPLEPGNVGYLLWMLVGYLLVTAVFVVIAGRLGDLFGRARCFRYGFVIFTVGAIASALTWSHGGLGATELIASRCVTGLGGALMAANSLALIIDAYPSDRRGAAIGINSIAAIAGSFLGLVIGGVVADHSWRAVFWVSVPFGVIGTVWSSRTLHDPARAARSKLRLRALDPWGNLTFTIGLVGVLLAMTYAVQPYGHHVTGWTSPRVLTLLIGGLVFLTAFVFVERRVADPMFDLGLFRIRAFTAANIAGLLCQLARGGMQFMLIIWLQGIWLPLHGYSFARTPLWAGIYLLPLSIGFLISGPLFGKLADRYGARGFATGGMLMVAGSFLLLMAMPANFHYSLFALLLLVNGIGSGMFASPNAAAVMNAVPASARGAASGMRSTFLNSGQVLSIGLFFSLLIVGLAGTMPGQLFHGLTGAGVPPHAAHVAAGAPPVGALFASFLGFDPVRALLPHSAYTALTPAQQAHVSGHGFFPNVISGAFMHGIVLVFSIAAALCVVSALASVLRGKNYVHTESESPIVAETAVTEPVA
jgi:MFS family permease